MAPKKKEKNLKRSNIITLKLTDIELAVLNEAADVTGLSRSPFNSFSFILTFEMLKVKFLSYFDFSKILFSHTLYFPPPSFVYVRGFVD